MVHPSKCGCKKIGSWAPDSIERPGGEPVCTLCWRSISVCRCPIPVKPIESIPDLRKEFSGLQNTIKEFQGEVMIALNLMKNSLEILSSRVGLLEEDSI
jgi:hypothetical protein